MEKKKKVERFTHFIKKNETLLTNKIKKMYFEHIEAITETHRHVETPVSWSLLQGSQ